MSAQHKRPLFAFMAVALIGALVVANAARSDAFRAFVERQAIHVAGTVLTPEPEPSRVAEPVVELTAESTATTPRPAVKLVHHRANGPAPTHAPAKAHGHPKATTPGHAKPHGHAYGHTKAKSHGKAKGHTKTHGNGHAKGHTKTKGHGQGNGKAKGHQKHKHHAH